MFPFFVMAVREEDSENASEMGVWAKTPMWTKGGKLTGAHCGFVLFDLDVVKDLKP